jgi:hypothetical protein
MKVDYSFNIVHDTIVRYYGSYVFCGNIALNSQGQLVMPGVRVTSDMINSTWFCSKMTTDGVLLYEHVFDEQQPYQSIIEIPEDHTYNLIDYDKIVKVDSNFNFLQTLYVVPTLFYSNTLFNLFNPKLSDSSSYIIGANTMSLGLTKDGAWGQFTNGLWSKMMSFGSTDTNDYVAGMDFITTKHIYSAISQSLPFYTDFDQIDNQMNLYSTSIDSVVHWKLSYNGLGFISSGIPIATKDTGCVWFGNYWDWHHKTNFDYDVVILKISPDGALITGQDDLSSSQGNWLVYSFMEDNLEISSDKANAKIRFYNSLGQLVLESSLDWGKTKLHVDNLKRGLYIYQILQDRKLVESGKWVKK